MTTEGIPMPIVIEKARLNLWNIISICLGIAVTAFGWGVTYSSIQATAAESNQQIASMNAEIREINAELPKISDLQHQITTVTTISAENRQSVKETNARIDRVVESFGGKLDTITDRMNQVVTSLEVLATRINSTVPQRRTSIDLNRINGE